MINEEATPLVIEIAKGFMALVLEVQPKWCKAYLRFLSQDSMYEAKASIVHEAGVEIVYVINHKDFFHSTIKKGQKLIAAPGETEGVFLLIAHSNFDYEIKFEYRDMNRWRISKLGGGSGVPVGLE